MSWKLWMFISAYSLLGLYSAYEQITSRKYLIAVGEIFSGVGKTLIIVSYFYTLLPSITVLLLFTFVLVWDSMDIFEFGIFSNTENKDETGSKMVLSRSMRLFFRIPVLMAIVPVIEKVVT